VWSGPGSRGSLAFEFHYGLEGVLEGLRAGRGLTRRAMMMTAPDMPLRIRPYRPSDLDECMEMVGRVWGFDERMPPSLATHARRLYVLGSLAESNAAWVADDDGVVEGFLFARCGTSASLIDSEYSGLGGQMRILIQLVALPGVGLRAKLRWLSAAVRHQWRVGRLKRLHDELTLFVVRPEAQGKGLGRLLVDEFFDRCRAEGVTRVVVETDRASNYHFYDRLGFTVVHEFESPLNALLTGGSGDSFIYEKAV
jgi:GNAT superfamily N-acetyltransferase